MADCECLARCLFFNDKLSDMPVTASTIKTQLCKGTNSRCARYMVFKALGRGGVPTDLYPSHTKRAKQIIAGT